jgi:hypothetical protein
MNKLHISNGKAMTLCGRHEIEVKEVMPINQFKKNAFYRRASYFNLCLVCKRIWNSNSTSPAYIV